MRVRVDSVAMTELELNGGRITNGSISWGEACVLSECRM